MTWGNGAGGRVPERHPQLSAADFVNPAWPDLHALCTGDAYVRPVSRAMENRAAVFTNQPQDVEVYQDGVWWPGSLLGWRHDTTGSCQVWVRIRIGGSESTVWTELEALRLPDAALERAAEPVASSWTDRASLLPEVSITRELHRIEDRVADGARPGSPAPRTGEARTDDLPSWRRAAAQGAAPGRHRAPAAPGAGRHRAADTEAFPAVTDLDSTIRHRIAPAPTPAGRSWTSQAEPDADVFTRRLRLNPLAGTPAPQLQATARNARLG